MKKKIFLFTTLIAVCLASLLLWKFYIPTSAPSGPSEEQIGQKVKSLYELANPGVAVDIVTMTEESGMYKAVLKLISLAGTNYAEVYVTKDGQLLTQGVIYVERSIELIQRQKGFVDCLAGKGVRIFGINNQTATLLQLNVLGIYGQKLYVSCDGELLQRCTDAGIQQVPSVMIGEEITPGIQTADWFATKTGCVL